MNKIVMILLMSLGLGSPMISARKITQQEVHKNCCCKQEDFCDCSTVTHLNQNHMDNANGLYLIKSSGCYILDADIVGNFTIEADNVCLDLNGHTLTGTTAGKSGNEAIHIESQSKILIKNGTMQSPDVIQGFSINLQDVTQICIKDLTFTSTSVAINLINSSCACIQNIDISKNAPENDFPLLFVDRSNTIHFSNVNASYNTVSNQPVLYIVSSNNISLECCKVNHNISTANSGSAAIVTFNSVNDLVMKNCQVTGNTAPNSTGSFTAVNVNDGENHLYKNCQFNKTKSTGGEQVSGFSANNVTQLVAESCESNGTELTMGLVNGVAAGFALGDCIDSTLEKCEAIKTTAKAALQQNSVSAFGFAAIRTVSDPLNITITKCLSKDALASEAIGFLVASVDTISLESNCAQNNVGTNEGYGFRYVTVLNSIHVCNKAIKNSSDGIAFSGSCDNAKLLENISVENGQSGFLFENTNTNFVLIRNSAFNNGKCGFEQIDNFLSSIWISNKAQNNTVGDFCLADIAAQQAANVQVINDKKACCKKTPKDCKADATNISFKP